MQENCDKLLEEIISENGKKKKKKKKNNIHIALSDSELPISSDILRSHEVKSERSYIFSEDILTPLP